VGVSAKKNRGPKLSEIYFLQKTYASKYMPERIIFFWGGWGVGGEVKNGSGAIFYFAEIVLRAGWE
jgi:hypothetical protein